MEKKKQLIVIISGVLIIIVLSLISLWELKNHKKDKQEENLTNYITDNNQIDNIDNKENENNSNDTFSQDELRSETPQGIKVPELGEEIASDLQDQIAIPKEVMQSVPGADTNIRSFEIRGEGGKFIPSKISVYQYDTVAIKLEAIDKDYDLLLPAYNMKQSAKMGSSKILRFQATKEGSFLFYCESCGGLESEAVGELNVVAK